MQNDIQIQSLNTNGALNSVISMQKQIWGESGLIPFTVLKVSLHFGGILLGAFVEGECVGFIFGSQFIREGKRVLWSYRMGVLASYRNHHLGQKLKEEQYRLSKEKGIEEICWSYDPLVSRNAHVNINKLGVDIIEYHETYYDNYQSNFNHVIGSDRVIVRWPISEKEPKRESIQIDFKDIPLLETTGQIHEAPFYKIEIPSNIQGLINKDPNNAGDVRRVNRDLFIALLKDYKVISFHFDKEIDKSYYIFSKKDEKKRGG